jgi:hypothetical protein
VTKYWSLSPVLALSNYSVYKWTKRTLCVTINSKLTLHTYSDLSGSGPLQSRLFNDDPAYVSGTFPLLWGKSSATHSALLRSHCRSHHFASGKILCLGLLQHCQSTKSGRIALTSCKRVSTGFSQLQNCTVPAVSTSGGRI